ncbi:GNAT family N-acetyltransferase [Clostridium polynesiense]|uniref:GNAT family N-acetyltransferase n=1 Tax=Clostridium polynesiense TaxID=1325933 RepID=UPI00058E3694|nr:GNAT family N-acetyltransferase [Clostridium polynesiense]
MEQVVLDEFKIRFAEKEDCPIILEFIKGLAEYEHMENQVTADCEILEESLFRKNKAQVIIGEYMGKPAAFALFFYNFSTFLGKPGIYLEDLFVKPEYRGKGIGKVMLSHIAKIAVEEGCGRFEWSCLDWNDPAISFYNSLGAEALKEWTVYRVTGEKLNNLAALQLK